MLSTDTDPQVAANCLYILRESNLLDETIITCPLVVSLLNRIRSFSDWAQCLVLDVLLALYRPESETERFDMLEILDFGLNHTNSAVVLATAKLFLQYTAAYPEQYGRVLTSIKGPLQTILLGREPEVSYAVLANVLLLAERHPGVFSDLSSDLFCRPEDPSYLKLLKLDALVAVADARNAYDAAEEASQYARDPEEEIARAAVRAVARIALKVVEVDGILDRLLVFLGQHRYAVAGEAVAAMAEVLRKFPDAAVACVPPVAEVDERALTRPESMAAYVWVLGEFGETLQDAPYLLESMIENSFAKSGLEGKSPLVTSVKLALLTAITKLFFKRPLECHQALGMALAAGSQDSESAVRDRALLYYRLLKESGPDVAKGIIDGPRREVNGFEETQLAEVRDKIFDEWNSLSVVYKAPAASFIELGAALERLEVDSIGGAGDGDLIGEGGSASDTGDVDGGTALLLDLNGGMSDGANAAERVQAGVGSGGSDIGGVDLGALVMGGSPLPGSDERHMVLPGSDERHMVLESAAAQGGIFGGSSVDTIYATNAPRAPLQPLSQPQPQQQQQQHAPSSALDVLGDLLGGTGESHAAAVPIADNTLGMEAPGEHALDDFMSSFMNTPTPTQQAEHTTPAAAAAVVELKSQPSPLDASQFQSLWTAWSSLPSLSYIENLSHSSSVSSIESRGFRDFIEYIKQANIISFAQPKEGSSPPYRFLFYSQVQGSDAYVLSQVIVSKSPARAAVEIKCGDCTNGDGQHVKELLQTLMMTY